MIRVVALCLVLGACSTPPRPATRALPNVPPDLASCAPGVPVPKPLPRVRTPAQIAEGYNAVDIARERAAKARADCALKLARLNEWVAGILNH